MPRSRDPAPRATPGQLSRFPYGPLPQLSYTRRPCPPDPQVKNSNQPQASVDQTCSEMAITSNTFRQVI